MMALNDHEGSGPMLGQYFHLHGGSKAYLLPWYACKIYLTGLRDSFSMQLMTWAMLTGLDAHSRFLVIACFENWM